MSIEKPLSLIAELTYRCPLHCPYCSNPLDCGSSSYSQELPTHVWLDVIQQAAQLGIVQIGFTGGEPLLRQDLESLVTAAATNRIYSTLVTSGIALSPARASRLQECGLDHIQISIQNSRAVESDAIAGTRSFEEKIAAARLVKALGFPLTLNVVLHRQNLDRIEEILDLCKALNADRVELAHTQYYGWALHNRAGLLPTPDQLERAERAIANARQQCNHPMGIVYVMPDYYGKYPKPCMGGWGRQAMVIAPNGNVLPCHVASSIPGLTFANVGDCPLEWIWFESEAFNRFRGTNWMGDPCRSCPRNTVDFGGCRCQALLLTGDATATDPVCHLSSHHHLVLDAQKSQVHYPTTTVHRSLQGITTYNNDPL
jgi:pyrroloquinoline quinone biosynthesis protein E